MKVFKTKLSSVMTLGLLAMAASSVAKASEVIWQCNGGDIEGLTVSAEENGQYPAGVAWDCFPGGGICNRDVQAALIHSSAGGTTEFDGPHFKLVIDTDSTPSSDGSFSGHISATGQGASDEGGGLSIDEAVSCTAGSR